MSKIFIHPLEHLVVQPDILSPGNNYSLDKLTNELKHERVITTTPANSAREALTIFKDSNVKITNGKKRYRTIPKTGWVQVEMHSTWTETWKEGMNKLKQQVRSK